MQCADAGPQASPAPPWPSEIHILLPIIFTVFCNLWNSKYGSWLTFKLNYIGLQIPKNNLKFNSLSLKGQKVLLSLDIIGHCFICWWWFNYFNTWLTKYSDKSLFLVLGPVLTLQWQCLLSLLVHTILDTCRWQVIVSCRPAYVEANADFDILGCSSAALGIASICVHKKRC